MRRRWVGKNVDLALLSERVGGFLKSRDFKTRKDELHEGHRISGEPHHACDVREQVDVRILGIPNEFVVEFVASERMRSSIRLGFITTMIGGGWFLLRGLRSDEALEKLEDEFWTYVENMVLHLTGSAKYHAQII